MPVKPVELDGEEIHSGIGSELDVGNLGFANGAMIPWAEDETLLLAGLFIPRLLLHDHEIVHRLAGEVVVVADDV